MLRSSLLLIVPSLFFCFACAQKEDKSARNTTKPVQKPVDKTELIAKSTPIEKKSKTVSYQRTEVRELGVMGGTLNLSIVGNPKSLNPILSNESISNRVLSIIFGTCFSFDYREQELRPALCEMVAQNEAGTEFTYTLREGLQWSDGQPLTSDDLEFSYRVLSDPKLKTYSRDLFVQGKDRRGRPMLPKFEKLDDRRFKIVLKESNQQFHLIASTMPIIPKHHWEKAYQSDSITKLSSPQSLSLPIVGSGPFYLEKYAVDGEILLKRNPHYWKRIRRVSNCRI